MQTQSQQKPIETKLKARAAADKQTNKQTRTSKAQRFLSPSFLSRSIIPVPFHHSSPFSSFLSLSILVSPLDPPTPPVFARVRQ
jgi:hypothetical protein